MNEPEGVALQLGVLLESLNCKIVLVESCTAGMAAAMLAGVPGMSRFLCGSIVAYQDEFKVSWLNVDRALIDEHTSVSAPVTRALATRVLAETPFADVSCAITGHLGPGAPADFDGRIFVAIECRDNGLIAEHEFRLEENGRIERQCEAARFMLNCLNHVGQSLRD